MSSISSHLLNPVEIDETEASFTPGTRASVEPSSVHSVQPRDAVPDRQGLTPDAENQGRSMILEPERRESTTKFSFLSRYFSRLNFLNGDDPTECRMPYKELADLALITNQKHAFNFNSSVILYQLRNVATSNTQT